MQSTATSAKEAKNQALEQAQQQAFIALMRRLVGAKHLFVENLPETADIVSLVQDLSIKNEKNTTTDYWADVDVQFVKRSVKLVSQCAIKLEKAAGYPKLNEALNVYVGDLENRIYDDLTETKNQISQGKKADIEKSMGHFESVIEVTRADNLVFSFQEQSLVWIDNYVPNIDIKYFNYDTQTGTLLNHNNVFKNESAVADLVAKTFTANNPEVKLPTDILKSGEYYIDIHAGIFNEKEIVPFQTIMLPFKILGENSSRPGDIYASLHWRVTHD